MNQQTKLWLLAWLGLAVRTAGVAQAQTMAPGTIRGTVVGPQRQPLPYATLVLRTSRDSAVYRSVLSENDGSFILSPVGAGAYFLEVRVLGFAKLVRPGLLVTATTPGLALGELALTAISDSLAEVVVRGNVPALERLTDKVVVNVAGRGSSEGATALELLQQLPGVQVAPDGRLTLQGKSGVSVLVDGKALQLSGDDLASLLRGMPATALQRVEVMTNPSARYEAAGSGGVLNLVRKTTAEPGLRGVVSTGGALTQYLGYNGGLTLTYQRPRYRLSWNNTLQANPTRLGIDLETLVRNPDQSLRQRQLSRSWQTRRTLSYVPTLGLDLFPSSRTTLGISLAGMLQSVRNETNSDMDVSDARAVKIARVLFTNAVDDAPSNYNAGVHLRQQFDSTGRELTVDLDYARYRNRQNQHRNTASFAEDSASTAAATATTLTTQARTLEIWAAKADYTHPLGPQAKLETGWKSSYVTSTTDFHFYNLSGGQSSLDPSQTNQVRNQESIHAGHLLLHREFKHLSLQAGTRAELTHTRGSQLLLAAPVVQQYLQLFPTLFLQYQAREHHTLNLQLGRRIDRADYSQLAPLRVAQSPTLFFQGNPSLRPQTAWHGELTYAWHETLALTVGYDQFQNYISTLPYLDAGGVTVTRMPSNIARAQGLAFDASLTKELFSRWTLTYSCSVFKQAFAGQVEGYRLDTPGLWAYNADFNNRFALRKGLTAEVNVRVISHHQEVAAVYGGYHLLSAGLRQQLWGSKATLALNVYNLLQSENESTAYHYQNLDQFRLVQFGTRALRLNATYRFGSDKEARGRPASSAAEEQRRTGMGPN